MTSKPSKPTAQPKRRTGILSMFTPLNVLLLTLLLGGAVALALTQFDAPAPAKPAAPVAATPPAPTTTTTQQPPRDRLNLLAPPPIADATPPAAAWEGIAVGAQLPLFATTPATLGLAPAPQGVRVPVNAVDLFTEKPTGFASPTKEYKGYKVAFCCANSSGYNGGWDHLTEAEKDTYVRSFLK